MAKLVAIGHYSPSAYTEMCDCGVGCSRCGIPMGYSLLEIAEGGKPADLVVAVITGDKRVRQVSPEEFEALPNRKEIELLPVSL